MVEERVERALQDLRLALDADGFALRLKSIQPDGSVEIVLVATPAACLDCLLPDDVLLNVLETAIRREVPNAGRIVLTKCNFSDAG